MTKLKLDLYRVITNLYTKFQFNISKDDRGKKVISQKTAERRDPKGTYRAPEYNVPPLLTDQKGRPSYFLIDPKNTNLVEDVQILLPVKFR